MFTHRRLRGSTAGAAHAIDLWLTEFLWARQILKRVSECNRRGLEQNTVKNHQNTGKCFFEANRIGAGKKGLSITKILVSAFEANRIGTAQNNVKNHQNSGISLLSLSLPSLLCFCSLAWPFRLGLLFSPSVFSSLCCWSLSSGPSPRFLSYIVCCPSLVALCRYLHRLWAISILTPGAYWRIWLMANGDRIDSQVGRSFDSLLSAAVF